MNLLVALALLRDAPENRVLVFPGGATAPLRSLGDLLFNAAQVQSDDWQVRELGSCAEIKPAPVPAESETALVEALRSARAARELADDTLRGISTFLGMGGCWDTEPLDYDEMDQRIRLGIDLASRQAEHQGHLSGLARARQICNDKAAQLCLAKRDYPEEAQYLDRRAAEAENCADAIGAELKQLSAAPPASASSKAT